MVLIEERNWEQILICLSSTHTISLREMCNILKSSRSWVNANITPFIKEDVITLSGGFIYENNKLVRSIDWRDVAALQLNEPKFRDNSVWFCTKSFLDYLSSCLVSCTQQTKRIPIGCLIKDHEDFYARDKTLQAELDTQMKIISAREQISGNGLSNTYKRVKEIKRSIVENIKDHLTEDGRVVYDNQPSYTQRYDGVSFRTRTSDINYRPVKRIPITFPNVDLLNKDTLIALHDIGDYGDSDESKYRKLFCEGAIRLEYVFNKDGKKPAQKIFYLRDPELVVFDSRDSYIYITREIYDKYFHLFSAYVTSCDIDTKGMDKK